jgi:hypothetical protein
MKLVSKSLIALALGLMLWTTAGMAAAQSDQMQYEVEITNLAESQVLSPPIVFTHAEDAHTWQVGVPASDEVRDIAEMGDTAALRSALDGMATSVVAHDAPIPPGESVSLLVSAREGDVLSALTMLVQTNDAITGLDAVPLSMSSMSYEPEVYDAGTEDNTELASDVPGPPFGGTNRAPTEPQQPIAMHSGISGNADVGTEYDWDGPVARFTVTPLPTSLPATGSEGTPTMLFVLILGVALAGLGLGIRIARDTGDA